MKNYVFAGPAVSRWKPLLSDHHGTSYNVLLSTVLGVQYIVNSCIISCNVLLLSFWSLHVDVWSRHLPSSPQELHLDGTLKHFKHTTSKAPFAWKWLDFFSLTSLLPSSSASLSVALQLFCITEIMFSFVQYSLKESETSASSNDSYTSVRCKWMSPCNVCKS